MTDDIRFLTDDEITLVCPTTRIPQTFKFIGNDDDGLRRYECQCGCGRNRLFPSFLPDERFEDGGSRLVEITNNRCMGIYYED